MRANVLRRVSARRGIMKGSLGSGDLRASRCAGGVVAQFIRAEKRSAPRGLGSKTFDFRERTDASARTGSGAIERRGSAAKFKRAGEGPVLKQGVSETAVKHVAGARGIHGADREGRRVMKLRAVPRESSVAPERRSGDAAAEAAHDFRQRLEEIRSAKQTL